jgi:simple sugar transport system permease protein
MIKKRKALSSTQIEQRFTVIRSLLAVVIAILFCFALILVSSENPLNDIKTFVIAPLTTRGRFYLMLIKLNPLIFSALAICVLFSANTSNLAVEGAFYAGALASSQISILKDFLPKPFHFIVAAIVGALGATAVLLIPAVLELKFNANIVVCSLMLNYVINLLGNYLICGPWRDVNCATEATKPIADSAKLTIFLRGSGQKVHTGILIGAALCVVTWFIIYKSNFGYQSRTVGQNANFAKFSGINVGKIVLYGSILAGCLCGVGATAEINGYYPRMEWSKSVGYGWDGIMIATLAGNNPLLCIPAALFLAYVRTSADVLSMQSNIPTEIVNIVQQVVIIMIAAQGLLAGAEKRAIVKNAHKLMLEEEEA